MRRELQELHERWQPYAEMLQREATPGGIASPPSSARDDRRADSIAEAADVAAVTRGIELTDYLIGQEEDSLAHSTTESDEGIFPFLHGHTE